MTSTIFRATVPLLALIALPALGLAQEPPTAPPAEMELDSAATARVQGWVTEMQELNYQLELLQRQAFEDPALNEEQAALGERVRAAMFEIDPALESSMARVDQLQMEAATAAQQADTARLEALGAEVRRIETQFVEAQQLALASPELSADLQAFQSRVEAKILELEPRVPEMIARFQELRGLIAATIGTGG